MKLFAVLLILSVLSFAAPGLVASPGIEGIAQSRPPGVTVTVTDRAEDPDASVRAIPFDVFVQVNDAIVYHGPAYFVNEHMTGAAAHPQVFVATDRQLVVLDIPPASEVVITTKPPTPQSSVALGHFGLRLSANGASLYSGEPWSLHIQREVHDTGIAAQVADTTSHTFKLEQGDEIVARSFFP